VCLALSAVSFAAESSVETNIVYGTYSGLALLMDIYQPARANGFGFVLINGSGWYRDLGYDANLLKQSPEFRPAREKLVTAREQHACGDEQTKDVPGAAADGPPHGDFAPAAHAAGAQQVRDIRAGHQQHEHHHAPSTSDVACSSRLTSPLRSG
jgi:hypothetical protein